MRKYFFLIFFSTFVLSACVNSSGEITPKEESYVTEITQLLPGDIEESFSSLIHIFGERGFTIHTLDPSAKSLVTNWVKANSNSCTVLYQSKTPIECQLRYIARIKKQDSRKSTVTLRHHQHCVSGSKEDISCPAPTAYQKLKEITAELHTSSTKLSGSV